MQYVKLRGRKQEKMCIRDSYDTVKIMVLLGVLILIISYIQSYFPPERAKKILGRFHGIWALSLIHI